MRIAFFTAVFFPTFAGAATLSVGPTGTYATINDAVADAADGDTIEVESGIYNEDVSLAGKSLTMQGSGSSSTQVIGQSTALTITDSSSFSISGLTLSSSNGRGFVVERSNGAFSDLAVEGITTIEVGAGGYISESTVTIETSLFANNEATNAGGGHLYIEDSTVDISLSTFDDGRSRSGGGIYAGFDSTLSIDECSFSENATFGGNSEGRGGAIRVFASVAYITNSSFNDNISGARCDGGAIALLESTADLENVTIDGSTAERDGGALYSEDSTLTATGLSVTNSEATWKGGAIAALDSDVTISDSVLENNAAFGSSADNSPYSGSGGAAYLEDSITEFRSTEFTENISDMLGGALYSNATLTLEQSAFTDNQSDYGGAIYLDGQGAEIVESTFTGNLATTNGGAVRWRDDSVSGEVLVSNSLFTENTAGDYGGAFAFRSGDQTDLIDNLFFYNTADWGGAVSIYGVPNVIGLRNRFCANAASYHAGGVRLSYTGDNVNEWRNNAYNENSSADQGGALHVQSSGYLDLVNNTIIGNDSALGSGIWADSTDIDFTNNILAWSGNGPAIEADSRSTLAITYSDFFENTGGDLAGSTVSTIDTTLNLAEDPLLTYVSMDGVCRNDQLWPLPGSPVIDAGDPTLIDEDGSVSDIGAYGGVDAFEIDDVTDNDGDGYTAKDDCNDYDANVFPGADEICNAVDDDCDTVVDGASATGKQTFYFDLDADGYGSASVSVQACFAPNGYVDDNTDCNDSNASVNPGAAEVCDGLDNDCNGAIDDNVATPPTWYPDTDGDGFGDGNAGIAQCEAPVGYVSSGDDCDDLNPAVNPSAQETCNGVDDDCNDSIDDEAVDGDTWYADNDNDGFGDPINFVIECAGPAGFTRNNTDCDDGEATVYPGAPEECTSRVDNNCDGLAGDPDRDNDGFVECVDCDDANPNINPDASEVWYDGIDQNCDEASDFDQDGDGFEVVEFGGTDCNDLDSTIYPGAEDPKGDDIDSNCDEKDGINPKFNDPHVDEGLKATPEGCGCDATGQPNSWILLLLPLVFVRNRRTTNTMA